MSGYERSNTRGISSASPVFRGNAGPPGRPLMSSRSIGRLCAGAAVSLALFVVATGSMPAQAQTHALVQTHAA